MQGNFFNEMGYSKCLMKFLLFLLIPMLAAAPVPPAETLQPFGADFPNLDSFAVGGWWEKKAPAKGKKGGDDDD